MVKLYGELFKHGITMIVRPTIGNSNTMDFVFEKGILHQSIAIHKDFLLYEDRLRYVEESLINQLRRFIYENGLDRNVDEATLEYYDGWRKGVRELHEST